MFNSRIFQKRDMVMLLNLEIALSRYIIWLALYKAYSEGTAVDLRIDQLEAEI